ncbi:MAG TPA: GntG family PLP-dependent aldolase [Actinomycetota bacterium]|nr:GntG family PLP-dependent aldolase [Actinomycetota bacterium]
MIADLRSDTLTRPTPAMRRAMAGAEVGDDLWREDPTTMRLEAAVAERFGREAALFVPSGTMGNQICLRLGTSPGTECLAHEDNHIFWYESGAAPLLSGVQLHALAGPRGRLAPEAVRARVRTAEYGVPTTAIAVEQTHNRGGGAVQPLADLDGLRAVADGAGLHLHCDGARIWNAAVASATPLERYGALFDSLSVCFSKGLAAPVGSAVVGDRELVERARRVRQLLGGGMRQSGVLAAAALVALDEMVDRLAVDHANARRAAETLAAALPGSTDPALAETNIVLLDAGAFGTDAPTLVKRLAAAGVLAAATGPGQLRLVFHYEVTGEDADRAARAIAAAAG